MPSPQIYTGPQWLPYAAFTPDTCSPDASCIHLYPLSPSIWSSIARFTRLAAQGWLMRWDHRYHNALFCLSLQRPRLKPGFHSNASVCVGKQPIGMLGRSSGNHDCERLRLNGNRAWPALLLRLRAVSSLNHLARWPCGLLFSTPQASYSCQVRRRPADLL